MTHPKGFQQAGYFLARLFVTLWAWHLEPRLWQEGLVVHAPHLALGGLVLLALLLVRIPVTSVSSSLSAPAEVALPVMAQAAAPVSVSLHRAAPLALAPVEDTFTLVRQAHPETQSLPPYLTQRERMIWYTAQVGDTVESVAARFGLQPTTIIWANPRVEKLPHQLLPGQVLRILPVDGVYHLVQEDESLLTIAQTYSSTVESILECPFNAISPTLSLQVPAGTGLVIPNGVKPDMFHTITPYAGPVPPDAVGTGRFIWPVSPEYGFLSQWYWWGHQAIDLAAPLGSAVRAADTGYVMFAGWVDTGYGNLVVLDHQNGYTTYYGHFDKILVEEGQKVLQGQVLGMVGDTGRSTGPHVHFEIRYQGAPVNPFRYLPAWEGYIWW